MSTVVRWRAASQIPAPWFTPDEQTYAALARDLYSSGHLSVLGRDVPFYSAVYPAVAGLALRLPDAEQAYAWLKAGQALLMSLTAVPVYLWGRRLMGCGWAVAACALTLASQALVFAGFVMTEVVFYPVLVLAAWATARMLEAPSVFRQAIAVATVALAVLTRLQAIVLVPAFVTAVLLDVLFEQAPRRIVRFLPAIGALALVGAVWVARPGSPLGAYEVTGSADYHVGDVARFVLYHAADVILFSALLPVVAVAVLASRAFAGREQVTAVRTYVATTTAFAAWLVVEVGAFTTRFLGRLAERNLIALAPLLFLGFGVWIDRGAPRPRLQLAGIGAAALALLAYVPWNAFVTRGAEPDAFSVIPLQQLRELAPGLSVRNVVLGVAALLLALVALLPRTRVWILFGIVAALLTGASVSASVVVTQRARAYDELLTLGEHAWIDRTVDAPVAYVYAGELGWSGGAPVWEEIFWNRRIARVYTLGGPPIYGPLYPKLLAIRPDGRVMTRDHRPLAEHYVVASRAIQFVGRGLRVLPSIQLELWQLAGAVRVSSWSAGINTGNGDVDGEARMTVYDCRTGALQLHVLAPGARDVEVRRNGVTFTRFHLQAGATADLRVPARPNRDGECSFALLARGGIHAPVFRFVRDARE